MREELDVTDASRAQAGRRLQAVTEAQTARFAELYSSYYSHVHAYCRRRSSADSTDDLVADVFLTAWKKIDNSPGDEAALPWLYRIAYHKSGNHWRTSKRTKQLQEKLESIGIEHATGMTEQVIARVEVEEVLAAAAHLSRNDQEMLRLFYWEQLNLTEIGFVLEIEPNTAKQRLHRARQRLVAQFEKDTGKEAVPVPEMDGEER